MKIYIVRAFTKDNKGGNKAGVVLEGDHIPWEDKASIAKELGVIGIHAFSLSSRQSSEKNLTDYKQMVEDDITAICRNFAPLYGINEESATGTSNCALACYLYENGYKKALYTFEQGHNLGQVSRILVKLICDKNRITKVYVGGYGVIDEARIWS